MPSGGFGLASRKIFQLLPKTLEGFLIDMTTATQDKNFFKEVVEENLNGLLEISITWISSNLSPDDVFSEKDLKTWAENNGYVLEDSLT